MEYVLTGVRQNDNIRQYTFQGVIDHKRMEFTIDADLLLVRKHRIPLQELPLLCRRAVEGRTGNEPAGPLTFTEKDMIGYVTRRAAEQDAAELKRRAHRRPPPVRRHV